MNAFPSTRALRFGGAAGFFGAALLGWNLAPDPTVAEPAAAAANHGSGRPALASGSGRNAVATEARRKMEAIRRAPTAQERLRATIALAHSLPVSQIPLWMEQRLFDRTEGYELTVFNHILKERWRKEDPGGMVAWEFKEGSGSGAIVEWAAREPQRVIEFLRDKADPSLAYRALASIAAKHPALALEGLTELAGRGGESETSYYRTSLLNQLAKSSPVQLEQALDSLPTALREQARTALVTGRLATDFSAELVRLANQSDGLRHFQNALRGERKFGERLVENLASIPASWRHTLASETHYLIGAQPEKWLAADLTGAGFSAQDAQRIQRAALMNFASRNPEQGISWLNKMSLTGDDRTRAVQTIFANLSGRPGQLEKASQLLASLSSPEDRAVAEQMLARVTDDGGGTSRSQPPSPTQPAEWLKGLAVLKEGDGRSFSYVSRMRDWDADKIAEVGRQFETLPSEQKTAVARQLVQSLSYTDFTIQSQALQHLAGLPEDRAGRDIITATSEHAVRWVKVDPEAAGKWVAGLPAGATKEWTQKNFAVNWAKDDYEAAERWVKALPAGERAAVETHFKSKTTR